jgi:hypothetical protein
MKITQLLLGNRAVLRAWLLTGACLALVAACSDDSSTPGETQAGAGGVAGTAQAGKDSGGTAQGGKGGSAQGGKAGSSSGGTSSMSGHAGEAGASAGEAGGTAGGASGAGGVGDGGRASAGEAGSGGEAGAVGNGGCASYDPQLASVDQQQLGNIPDSWNVYESAKIGEFITAGKTGLLSGVELSLQVAANANSGSLQLNVYDMNNALLGHGTLAISAVAGQPGGKLVADQVGAAFFDLSSQCITVTAAEKLRIELHLVGDTGTCVATKCVGGPAANGACSSDAHCTGIIISASQPSTYAGGSIAFGTDAGSADDNLNFKTFVVE